jgi:penicillin-binding protein 1A
MVSNLRAGGVREGASTITMQLARNVFLGNRAAERSYARKFLEWRYATLLEQALTKDEILERYLNAIYLGNGVYGVEAASRDLFGKRIGAVTLAEAALRSRDRDLARRLAGERVAAKPESPLARAIQARAAALARAA